MAWAKNGTPHTLTSAGDTLTISDLTAKKFNQFLNHNISPGSYTEAFITLNNNTSSVYAFRYSSNGAADVTNTSLSYWDSNPAGSATTDFSTQYIISITGQEKLMIGFLVIQSSDGSGTAPNRIEYVGKFVPSPDADITRIDLTNAGTSDWSINSNLTAMGTD